MAGWLEATRPGNVAMVGLAVLIGGWTAGADDGLQLAAAAGSAMLIGAAGNIDNDRCDLAIDQLNRPTRPLPSGRLSDVAARRLALGFAALGLLLSLRLGASGAAVAAVVTAGLWSYNRWWKRLPLVGNLTVAAIVALSLVYGGLAGAEWAKTALAAVLAGLLTLGREILKDIEDRSGDAALGLRTLPVVFGIRPALAVTTAILAATILVSGYLLLHHKKQYQIGLIGAVDAMVVAVGWTMWRDASPPALRRLSTLLKLAMLVGLVALI